jgi:hypothetical protein
VSAQLALALQTVPRTGLTIALIVAFVLVLGFLGWLYGRRRYRR